MNIPPPLDDGKRAHQAHDRRARVKRPPHASRTQRTRAPSPNGARLAPIGFAEGLDRSPGSWRRPRETGWRSGNHDDLPANLSSPVVLRVDIDVKTARLHELPEARTRRW